jgi:hypothetical protein
LECNKSEKSRKDTQCPLGQLYCLETESCAEKCAEVQTVKDNSEKTCPEGQKLCLATGLCALICNEETEDHSTDTNDRGLGRITKREAFDCPGLNFNNRFDNDCSKKLVRFV